MILDCLKEYDVSIKKKALDLILVITTKKNVKSIVKELLNLILTEEEELLSGLAQTICISVEKYAPSRRWHIDSVIKVLTLAGNFVEEDSIASLIHLISATPSLQMYAICKTFFSLRENLN